MRIGLLGDLFGVDLGMGVDVLCSGEFATIRCLHNLKHITRSYAGDVPLFLVQQLLWNV